MHCIERLIATVFPSPASPDTNNVLIFTFIFKFSCISNKTASFKWDIVSLSLKSSFSLPCLSIKYSIFSDTSFIYMNGFIIIKAWQIIVKVLSGYFLNYIINLLHYFLLFSPYHLNLFITYLIIFKVSLKLIFVLSL